MNFQLKLYQLIKPRLRDQKYEISSWSSLLSFESDGYPGKQSVGRCCSLSFRQTTLYRIPSTPEWSLVDWSTLFICLRKRMLRGVKQPWVSLVHKEHTSEIIQGGLILVQPNVGNTPRGCWICQTSHLSASCPWQSYSESQLEPLAGALIFLLPPGMSQWEAPTSCRRNKAQALLFATALVWGQGSNVCTFAELQHSHCQLLMTPALPSAGAASPLHCQESIKATLLLTSGRIPTAVSSIQLQVFKDCCCVWNVPRQAQEFEQLVVLFGEIIETFVARVGW